MPNKGNRPPPIPACHPDRKHCAKGLCKRCYDTAYAKNNVARANYIKNRWKKKNPEQRAADRRKYIYGVDADEIRARLNAQDGLCKICQKAPARNLDHDHKTGAIRSMLCMSCNWGLGSFKEDRGSLLRAIQYLDLWGSGTPWTPEEFKDLWEYPR